MPKWWTDRAKSIRERNPEMPKGGMEWALATEQYKEKFGHPPRRHKSKKKGHIMFVEQLIKIADLLDEQGLRGEADIIDRMAAGLMPGKSRKKFDPMTNPLPSKVKEVLDNPVFQLAVKSNDFGAAKDIVLSTIMESEINDEDKQRILNNVERIEQSEFGASTQQLQDYLYNSWLKYIGLGVISQEFIERLLVFADKLDTKGLFEEANKIDSVVHTAYVYEQELSKMAPQRRERRQLALSPESPEAKPSSTCPQCGQSIFTTNVPCPGCGYVSEEKEIIEEL